MSTASHPAPAPIVGERVCKKCNTKISSAEEITLEICDNCSHIDDGVDWHPQDYSGKNVPTDRAIPEEMHQWIINMVRNRYPFEPADGSGYNSRSNSLISEKREEAEKIAIAMYQKLSEPPAISNAKEKN